MFVQDFQLIDRPYPQVAGDLRVDPGAVLAQSIGPASEASEHLRTRVGPASWPALLTRTVELHLGLLRPFRDGLIVAFSWDSPHACSVLPHLDADLEIAPFGVERTEAILRGRYQAPGGVIGRGVDEAVLHRIAEATLRSFLVEVCRRLALGAESYPELGTG